MSTLRAATLTNLAGTGSPDITGGELARARFNLNGTGTIAARDTFNVSSFVDNGTGSYTANFAVSFPNADYTVAPSARVSGTIIVGSASMESASVSAAQVFSSTVAATPASIDPTYMMAAFFGDRP